MKKNDVIDVVTATYPDTERASKAVHALVAEHFDHESIRVLLERGDETRVLRVESRTMGGRAALLGAAIGLVVGAIVGALGVAGLFSLDAFGISTKTALDVLRTAIVFSGVLALGGFVAGNGIWRAELRLRADDRGPARVHVEVRVHERRVAMVRALLERAGAESVTVG